MLADILRPLAAFTLRNPDQGFIDLLGGGTTRAGLSVTPDKALGLPAVFSVVSFLADTIAGLPLQIFQRGEDGSRDKLDNHSISGLLQTQANPMMSAYDFRVAMGASVELRGNGYAEIIRGPDDRPIELWFLPAQNMEVKLHDSGRLVYLYREPTGRTVELRAKDVLHVRALALDGFKGVSPLTVCRENIALGMAGEAGAAAFYGNGSVPDIALVVPGDIKDDQRKASRKSWEAVHGGVNKSHKVAVLSGGITVKQIGVNPDDAQALESRQFSVTDVARMFRVPPHIIGDLERATFSNIEAQYLEVVRFGLMARFKRWESAIDIKLLGASRDFFSKHNVDALQRGDTVARYTAHKLALEMGWMNRDEVRALEDKNPIPDGSGQDYNVQNSAAPSGSTSGTGNEEPDPPAASADDNRVEASFEPLWSAAFGRLARVENDKIKRAKKREGFAAWVPGFVKAHSGHVRKELIAVTSAYWESTGNPFDATLFESAADAYMANLETWLLSDIPDATDEKHSLIRSMQCSEAFAFALRKGDSDGHS